YLIAAVGLAIANYRRLRDTNERRRVRLIFAGLCVAVAANLPRILFARGPLSSTWPASIIISPAASMAVALASLSIPVSFAIVITRDRLFEHPNPDPAGCPLRNRPRYASLDCARACAGAWRRPCYSRRSAAFQRDAGTRLGLCLHRRNRHSRSPDTKALAGC